MRQVNEATDLNGRPLERGDTVTTICGGTTGRIKDIVTEDGTRFIEIRPLHRSTGKGVWHAADRVLWLSSAGRKTSKPAGKPKPATATKTRVNRSATRAKSSSGKR
ncbi:MAG: hypothetical protein Kow00105_13840 [Phycisphaeraceae bacterium]